MNKVFGRKSFDTVPFMLKIAYNYTSVVEYFQITNIEDLKQWTHTCPCRCGGTLATNHGRFGILTSQK